MPLASQSLSDLKGDHLSPKMFEAPTDGVTDATASVQAAIDALPVGGTLDGVGLLYVVTSLLLKSWMTLQNFRFKTKAGAVDHVNVIHIDGRVNPQSDILLLNIFIDGNRQNQTSVNVSTQNDGDRNGFCLEGFISNVTLNHCTAQYCATDGFYMNMGQYSSQVNPPTSDDPDGLCLQNIRVHDSHFLFNRRQGGSGASIHNVAFTDCTFENNGTDIGSGPPDSGKQGARAGGNLYGTGFWLENYGPPSMGANNLRFMRCQFFQNYTRSFYGFQLGDPTVMGFLPFTGIHFDHCDMDAGQVPFPGNIAVQFQSNNTYFGVAASYKDIQIVHTTIAGVIALSSADGVLLSGITVNDAGTVLGFAEYTSNLRVMGITPAKAISSSGHLGPTSTPWDITYAAGTQAQVQTGWADPLGAAWSGSIAFSAGTANQLTYLDFGNVTLIGSIIVEVSSSFNGQDAVGYIRKEFGLGRNPGGAPFGAFSRVRSAFGDVLNHFAIGDPVDDGTGAHHLILPIYHISTIDEVISVAVRVISTTPFDPSTLTLTPVAVVVNTQGVQTEALGLVNYAVTGIVIATAVSLRAGIGAGLFRVSWYLVVTASGTGTSISVQITWNDGTTAQVNSPTSTNPTINFHQNGNYTVRSDGSADVVLTVVYTGITINPTYSLWATIERLT